jgi:hypothetical protein
MGERNQIQGDGWQYPWRFGVATLSLSLLDMQGENPSETTAVTSLFFLHLSLPGFFFV